MRKKLIALALLASAGAYAQDSLPSWALGPFTRPAHVNPIISPDSTTVFTDPITGKALNWESNDTFNPGAVVKDGKIVVLYRAEDKSGVGIGFRTSRLGYAESKDGIHFHRRTKPVLFPANDSQKSFEWPGGCEDPRVAVTPDGTYVVFYTQWNRDLPRLGVATSRNLIEWKKHGPIFRKAYNGKFANIPHKSASIVTRIRDNKIVIEKLGGKYWMYWGELGVFAATSDNLTDWTPLTDKAGELKPLISPRPGYFDSHLTECGPPAILTDSGILLLYNGKNLANEQADKNYPVNTYAAGQVLFDRNNPAMPLSRLDKPFMVPSEPFEKSGQYKDGTVFLEGLAFHNNKWFLYYGCADSRVAVAIYDPSLK